VCVRVRVCVSVCVRMYVCAYVCDTVHLFGICVYVCAGVSHGVSVCVCV